MKPSEAAELVMMLLGAYPNAKSTAATGHVFESMLADLDVRTAREAVKRLIATSKFMPSVAEIREECAAIDRAKAAAAARERSQRLFQRRRPRLTDSQLGTLGERALRLLPGGKVKKSG